VAGSESASDTSAAERASSSRGSSTSGRGRVRSGTSGSASTQLPEDLLGFGRGQGVPAAVLQRPELSGPHAQTVSHDYGLMHRPFTCTCTDRLHPHAQTVHMHRP